MENRNWSNNDLSDYISNFSDVQRESVLKEILEAELLAKFISKTEGRLLLNSVVDQIRDLTMSIVSLSVDGFDENSDKIKQAALQINVAYDFMYKIANMVTTGDQHIKNIKPKKKKGK